MSTPIRVLIVENSEDDALLLLEALRHGGYEPEFERVQTAESMRTALRGRDWDLILCDYSMPVFDAPAALRVLQETARDLPFIIVSGIVGEEVAIEALKLGADDYLLKQNLIRLIPAIERSLKDAESRRRHSAAERMTKLIMAHSFDIIWVLDEYGRHLDTSAASLQVLGYDPEELVGQDAFQHVHPDDLPLCRKAFEDAIAGNAVRDFECRSVRKDGRIIHMMWSAYWSPDDRLLFVVGRDITERKRAEGALHLAAERIQLAAQVGKMGIWEVDLATGIPIWDDQMYRLYGLTRGAAPDGFERWHRRFHPEDAARAKSELQEALENPGTPLESEFRIIREDDGRTCHIRRHAHRGA